MNVKRMAVGDVIPPRRIPTNKPHQAGELALDRLGWFSDEALLRRLLQGRETAIEVGLLSVEMVGLRVEAVPRREGCIQMSHRDFDLFPSIQRAADRGKKNPIRSVPARRKGWTIPGMGHG